MKVVPAIVSILSLHAAACMRANSSRGTAEADPERASAGAEAERASASAADIVEDPGAAQPEPVKEAVAVLHPTAGSSVHGTVRFAREDGQLKVTASASGLPAGPHAYHVHLYGDCSGPEAKTAGTHFNFQGSSKRPPADIQRITGNLGELQPGADGSASAETTLEEATLQGPYSIIGRSVVIHEQGNDPSQPPIGGAGSRLACGVIGIAEDDPS